MWVEISTLTVVLESLTSRCGCADEYEGIPIIEAGTSLGGHENGSV